MDIRLSVERTIAAPVDTVFAAAVDPQRFPRWFGGCGPVPAIRAIRPHAPPAIGSTRTLENSDGSRVHETITDWAPPFRHGYVLGDLGAPVRWLARRAVAEWRFESVDGHTRVQWRYCWTLTSPLAWPLAWPLLQGCLRTAMRRCLVAMGDELAARPDAVPASATLAGPR